MKLVFCGTPQFAVPSLEKIVGAGYDVRLVVTQPDRSQGRGISAAAAFGSAVHDEIGYESSNPSAKHTRFTRAHNYAGGLEGGVSNGEDIVVRGYLKPISTLRRPLQSVDFKSREPVKAAYERSDVCVVPAAGVAGEAMVALTLAKCLLEKFGGDSMTELQRNFKGYCQQVRDF